MDYEQLPNLVKDNLSEEQWRLARQEVIEEHQPVPETTDYINLRNGQIHRFEMGVRADGPLLPVHDLSGGGGKDSTQFFTEPGGQRRSA
jgi:hypothetical protein